MIKILYLHCLKHLNVETKVINISDIKSAIGMKGLLGDIVGKSAMSLLALNDLNDIYSKCCAGYGKEFTSELLRTRNIKCDVLASQLEVIPKEGPFIIVSNHPFGGIDGVILFDVISSIRPDFKILTNFILSRIKNLSDYFLPVNPFSDMKNLKNSFSGIRAAREHLLNGGCLGLFPAGEVSTYHGKGYTEDIEWTQSIAKLISKSNVPVIPVYFDGQNSRMFHALGRIHPLLRTAQLPRELTKVKDKTITLRIGKPISPSEIQEHNINSLRRYLRNRTYALEAQIKNIPVETEQLRKSEDEAPIAPSKGKEALMAEIEKLNEKGAKLFDAANFSCYIADYEEIPALIHEIGIKREEAFRAVGEGTGMEADLDKYDIYYKHLILWDNDKSAFAGAYRLGIGAEIMAKYGKRGFYSQSLFKYSQNFTETLSSSIELGRSFVSLEYKKDALPLMLLIRGLMYSILRYDECKYLFGPVSISSSYPLFYRSLMTYYIMEMHSRTFLKKNVKGRTPFKPDFMRVSPRDLIETKIKSIETFDRYMLRLSDNQYRLPTLVKQYLKLGAKIACFNVDKDFNYCIDGLVFLKIADVPKDEIMKLARGAEDPETILNRFRD